MAGKKRKKIQLRDERRLLDRKVSRGGRMEKATLVDQLGKIVPSNPAKY